MTVLGGHTGSWVNLAYLVKMEARVYSGKVDENNVPIKRTVRDKSLLHEGCIVFIQEHVFEIFLYDHTQERYFLERCEAYVA